MQVVTNEIVLIDGKHPSHAFSLALIEFSNLARQVYVNPEASHIDAIFAKYLDDVITTYILDKCDID
ncbi:MAG: hypothetical protein Tp118SUR00d2C21406231_54 [Prokaryotic dsDNA virus sp.]|mgnify:FL=1|nr:MAG: hypothetical protein Tp125DCM00d2C40298531_73 [Prokaryotic dsDNA virus sp.]QDP53174.1 MAG: hypothetical protein Tp118SUR00d2C21406231_54 [Prokaryotic dsDNA virus sp.]|tara:strand:- start:28861 stop:29061 length:201 start_codon:yes stop_codon:yes gene_type:complete